MKKTINSLTYYYTKLPDPSNWLFWFALALIIKTSLCLYQLKEYDFPNNNYHDTFGIEASDSQTYIEPIENLLKKGEYFDDYRMPGLGWIYLLMRMIFPIGMALDAIIILQLILSSFSVYLAAKIAQHIFSHPRFFYTTFLLFSVSTFVSLYDTFLLTESFCVSSLIFSIFLLVKPQRRKIDYLLSGLFTTWVIFLRPVYAPLIFLFAIFVLTDNLKKGFLIKSINRVLFFIIPFIFFDGIWVARNYERYNKIYPLTKSLHFTNTEDSYLASLFSFMGAFGGSIVWWNEGNEITFFKENHFARNKPSNVVFPSNIYTSKFNYDSLVAVKKLILLLDSPNISPNQKILLTNSINLKFDTYTLSIKNEKPFLYHITSRFKLLKNFFLHSGTYNLFLKPANDLSIVDFIFKVCYSLLYVFTIVFGFAGLTMLLLKYFASTKILLLSFLCLYSALVFPLGLKLDEYRYFVPAYPFFLIASIYALITMVTFLKNKNPNSNA